MAQVELCRTKWKLVKLQLSAFERASLTKLLGKKWWV
jgi:hypothetical protein